MSTSKHIGSKFGKLTVTGVAEMRRTKSGSYVQVMNTICECGKTRQTLMTLLTSGGVKACKDCVRPFRNTVNIQHPLYRRYWGMRNRCYYPTSQHYSRYGGRGIKVCDRWLAAGLEGFANFVADMGSCPEGMTLNRINNDGDYTPENCTWSTSTEQNSNKSNTTLITVGPETKTWAEWARHLNQTTARLDYPRKIGYTREEIIEAYVSQPKGQKNIKWPKR